MLQTDMFSSGKTYAIHMRVTYLQHNKSFCIVASGDLFYECVINDGKTENADELETKRNEYIFLNLFY